MQLQASQRALVHGQRLIKTQFKKMSPLLGNRLQNEKSKMAAATARQIPVVNNVITDEDLDNFRTEGKVSMLEMEKLEKIAKQVVIFAAFWPTCSSQCHQNTQTSYRQALGESSCTSLVL